MTGQGPSGNDRGYCAIGIVGGKVPANLGTLWRTAHILGAAYVFTVGCRYPTRPQRTDTLKSTRHVPVLAFDDVPALLRALPTDCSLLAVEMDPAATPLADYKHPERAVYLLGAEDNGIDSDDLARCDRTLSLPGAHSLNVAVAGSIVLYDRTTRRAVASVGGSK